MDRLPNCQSCPIIGIDGRIRNIIDVSRRGGLSVEFRQTRQPSLHLCGEGQRHAVGEQICTGRPHLVLLNQDHFPGLLPPCLRQKAGMGRRVQD